MSPTKWLLLTVVVSACAPTSVAGPTQATGSAPPAGSPSPSVVVVAPASAGSSGSGAEAPIVIEDAGINVDLRPGIYTSRVFRPKIEFELGAGWERRDATHDVGFSIADPGHRWFVAVRQLDFAQCGKTLIEHPRAAAAGALIGHAAKLAPRGPSDLHLGDRTGLLIDLPGTGQGVGESIDPMNGCVLSQGDAPFPAEGGWIVLNPDTGAHLVIVDVADKTLTLLGRASAADLPAATRAMDAVLSTIRFPENPVVN